MTDSDVATDGHRHCQPGTGQHERVDHAVTVSQVLDSMNVLITPSPSARYWTAWTCWSHRHRQPGTGQHERVYHAVTVSVTVSRVLDSMNVLITSSTSARYWTAWTCWSRGHRQPSTGQHESVDHVVNVSQVLDSMKVLITSSLSARYWTAWTCCVSVSQVLDSMNVLCHRQPGTGQHERVYHAVSVSRVLDSMNVFITPSPSAGYWTAWKCWSRRHRQPGTGLLDSMKVLITPSPSARYWTAKTCWSRRYCTTCAPIGSRNWHARTRQFVSPFRCTRWKGRWDRRRGRRRRAQWDRSAPTFPCVSSCTRGFSDWVLSSSTGCRRYRTRTPPKSSWYKWIFQLPP